MDKEVIRVVAAVIERDGRYLITQRKPVAVLPLLWEFPGGRVESGETEPDALVREVRGRIGAEIVVRDKIGEHHHEYQYYEVVMTMYSCRLQEGNEPHALGVYDLRWVTSSELRNYEFPPADEQTMNKLLGRMMG